MEGSVGSASFWGLLCNCSSLLYFNFINMGLLLRSRLFCPFISGDRPFEAGSAARRWCTSASSASPRPRRRDLRPPPPFSGTATLAFSEVKSTLLGNSNLIAFVNVLSSGAPCGRGLQRITTPEGYIIPQKIKQGLPYMGMTCPSDEEMNSYPYVVFTSDLPWDPSIYDDDDADDPLAILDPVPIDGRVNQYGEVPWT